MKEAAQMRLLYVCPQHDGAHVNGLKTRIKSIGNLLSEAKVTFEVLSVPRDEHPVARLGDRLSLPFMRPYLSKKTEAAIRNALTSDYTHVIVSTMMLAPYLAQVRRWAPHASIVFDMQDRYSRQIFQDKVGLKAFPKQIVRYFMYFAWEYLASSRSDAVILLSSSDSAFHIAGRKLFFVNNGSVNVPVCSVRERLSPPYNLLFVGDYKYKPNLDGVRFLLSSVVPILPEEFVINLVGSGLPPDLSEINHPRVVVHGYVEELKSLLESATAVLVPLFQGTGIKNKVVEGMMAGRVVATTNIGNDGVEAQDGAQVVLFEGARDLVDKLVAVVDDNAGRVRMEALARSWAAEKFSDSAAATQLLAVLKNALR